MVADTFEHPALGTFTSNFGVWQNRVQLSDNRIINLSLWDGAEVDMELVQKFIQEFARIEAKCKAILFENHTEIVGLVYNSWLQSEREMMAKLFSQTLDLSKISADETWGVLQLKLASFFREPQDTKIKLDYKYLDTDVDYIMCFELDKFFEINDVSIES